MSKEETPKFQRVEVVIKKIDLSFSDWVGLMVKVGLASVPAAIVLGLIYYIFISLLAELGK